jgi:hypothetical protein
LIGLCLVFGAFVMNLDAYFVMWAFWKIWNGGGCNSKTAAKMAVARIKLLRNKREAVMRQMRRDIALLLQSGQDATARIRVFKKCCLCLFLYHILGFYSTSLCFPVYSL